MTIVRFFSVERVTKVRGLKVEGLTKTYGEKVLFDHISFSVAERDRIGLIGVNGTGKSTLLKVLAGSDTAEAGMLDHPNDYQVEYLDQDPDLDKDLTVLDQIYYGHSPMMETLRNYEKTVLALEGNPESEVLQQKLLKQQEKMDVGEAWDAMTVAKTVLSKLGISSLNQKKQQSFLEDKRKE